MVLSVAETEDRLISIITVIQDRAKHGHATKEAQGGCQEGLLQLRITWIGHQRISIEYLESRISLK